MCFVGFRIFPRIVRNHMISSPQKNCYHQSTQLDELSRSRILSGLDGTKKIRSEAYNLLRAKNNGTKPEFSNYGGFQSFFEKKTQPKKHNIARAQTQSPKWVRPPGSRKKEKQHGRQRQLGSSDECSNRQPA